jgi:uncharacterized protein (DUF885 family)
VQLSTYFVGLEGILALEAEDRARGGDSWSRREFVARLLGHGSPPLPALRALLAASGATDTTAAGR